MIEALSIRNFQKHKHLKVRLADVTTFCGPSDTGKSSVIRALGWLAFNRPRGDFFIRKGVCSVAAKVDGCTIARRRSKTINEYRLEKEIFKAIGSDVPEQICDLLSLDGEINYQGQHDVPFWIGLSSAEVARRLNRIADLEIVDKVSADISSILRKELAKEQALVEQCEETYEKLQRFGDIDRVDRLLKEYEQMSSKGEAYSFQADELREAIDSYGVCRGVLNSASSVISLGKEAVKFAASAEKAHLQVESIESLLERISQASMCLSTPLPDPDPAETAYIRYWDTHDKCSDLESLLSRISEVEEAVSIHAENAKKGEAWLKEHTPDVCSECGREL